MSERSELGDPTAARVEAPRLLVTNDDGIDSPGLRVLANRLVREHEVVVAAPSTDMSGSGTGIGRYDPDAPTSLARHDFDGVEAYAVDGPPGLAVMAAALGAFGRPPTLVVSGVNAGMNTGHALIHSGTVGGALTAHTFGASGVAISLDQSEPWQWETAASLAPAIVRWLLGRPRTTLNVNVPAVAVGRVAGARWAPLDEFGHFRLATADVPGGILEFEVGDRRSRTVPGSDTALCRAGHVTLTLLNPIEPDVPPTEDAEVVTGLRRGVIDTSTGRAHRAGGR